MDVVEGLHKQGRSFKEIVKLTGLSINAVKKTLTLLRKAGRIENKQEAERRKYEPDRQQRMKAIAWMRRHGFSEGFIANMFERPVRPQRIQQIIRDQIIPEMGREAVTPPKPTRPEKKFWSISKAAAVVGVSHGIVADLVREEEIPFETYYDEVRIFEEGIAKLKNHPRVLGIAHCAICGREFRVDHGKPGEPRKGGMPRKICEDPACKREYDRQQLVAMKNRGASNMHLIGWREKAWEVLKVTPSLNGDEQWVSLGEALKASGGLSTMQVTWLRQTGMVQTRPHPEMKRTNLYALSQVKIAGEAFREWNRRNGK